MKQFESVRNVVGATLRRLAISGVILIACVVVFSTSDPSFAGTQTKKMAMEKAASVFDTAGSYKPTNADETVIVGIIRNNLKNGFERRDLGLIKAILSADFKYRLLTGKNKTWVDTRETYLGARTDWVKSSAPVRNLKYVIQSVSKSSLANELRVMALSSRSSKHFSPKFIETLVFSKTSGKWLLKNQSQVPLHHQNPAMNTAQIFVTERFQGHYFMAAFLKRLRTVGASAAVGTLLKGAKYDNEVEQSVIVVFREPPPPGSTVHLKIKYGVYDYPVDYKIETVDPYLVIETSAGEVHYARFMTVKVFVDGQEVANRTITVADNK